MKRLFLLGLILAFVPTYSAFAIPNPASTYCAELGYTLEGNMCVFSDGEQCPDWEFYVGECGVEYKKPLACKKAGEPISISDCCEGLATIINDEPGEIDGCAGIIGGYNVCSDCGNSICERWENSCNCPADCKLTPFADADGHKYQSSIEYVKSKNIVDGYDDGTYRPDNLINRAEFTKIIVNALYSYELFENEEYGSCFSDISPDEWFTKYVCFAKEIGVINGYGDNTFKPAKNINYVEALKIIIEAYIQKGLIEDFGATSDDATPPPWYYNYVKYSNDMKLSFSQEIENDQSLTRGETAEMIQWIDTAIK